MFETYSSVFDERAASYHRAMKSQPRARAREFAIAVQSAGIEPGHVVCDVPSGGGYLREHLPEGLDVELISIDSSAGFTREWPAGGSHRLHLSPLDAMPLADDSVDRVLSIAGLHHERDRGPVFREMRRILRAEGRLIVLEVPVGAATDGFLNGFVHEHNSLGHQGRFVDEGFREDLRAAGFRITTDELVRYTWDFDDECDLVVYTRLMFGLDRATDEQILEAVRHRLGLVASGSGCSMNWELQLLCCH